MPLQNRVDPYGNLFRNTARGTMLGNRGGCMHNEAREIVRPYVSRRWIACVLEFKGRHRTVMSPRRYTELFFLDEAVAFAAGHRPCAECRRSRFNAFKNAWRHWKYTDTAPMADDMDVELHRSRVEKRAKVTYRTAMDALPDGCFVEVDGAPWLVWRDALLLWTPERYAQKRRRAKGEAVTVLTPRPMVECLRSGYELQIHDSAFSC